MAVTIRIDLTQRSQNIQGNYSVVNAKVYAISTSGSYAYDNPAGSLTLDGQTYNFNHNFDPNTTTLIYEVDKTCYHDSNGNKTVSASAWFNGTGSYTVYASASLALTHINRQSALGNIGFINDTDTITLNITKYNSSYTHELNVYKRNNDDTIDTSVLYATRSGVENGDTFTFTQAELDYLYQQNTDRRNIAVMFVLSTYQDTTKIGDSNSKGIVNITNAMPIFTDFDYEDSNIITSALTGDNSKIVLGYSNLEVTIPVADKATPQKYATMESYIIDNVVLPYSSSADVTTTINNYNKTSISVFAKDSRDFSTEVNKPLTTIAYTPIVKGNQSISRVGNVGTQITVEFDGTFWNDTFGNTTNDLTVTYRFKKSTDTNWTTGTFIGSVTKSGNNYSYSGGIRGDASDNGFEVDDSYDIELTVSDVLSSVLYTYQLIAGNPAIIVKGNEVSNINNNGHNLIDNINGLITYDDTETFTGKYYKDGKPIYRKEVDLGLLGSSSTFAISGSYSHIVFFDGYIMTSSGIKESATAQFSNMWRSLSYSLNNNGSLSAVYVRDNVVHWSDWTLIVYMEYTKTTD